VSVLSLEWREYKEPLAPWLSPRRLLGHGPTLVFREAWLAGAAAGFEPLAQAVLSVLGGDGMAALAVSGGAGAEMLYVAQGTVGLQIVRLKCGLFVAGDEEALAELSRALTATMSGVREVALEEHDWYGVNPGPIARLFLECE
jgi:hypothetical protein